MRRTLLLLALGAVVFAALHLVPPPRHETGEARAARGHRMFAAHAGAVRGLSVSQGARRVEATRTVAGAWAIDGVVIDGVALDAVDGLLKALLRLRALDAFRPLDGATFGLDNPRGTVDLRTDQRTWRLLIGGHTADGAAFYAKQAGDPRVFKVGAGLDSQIERLLYVSRTLSDGGT